MQVGFSSAQPAGAEAQLGGPDSRCRGLRLNTTTQLQGSTSSPTAAPEHSSTPSPVSACTDTQMCDAAAEASDNTGQGPAAVEAEAIAASQHAASAAAAAATTAAAGHCAGEAPGAHSSSLRLQFVQLMAALSSSGCELPPAEPRLSRCESAAVVAAAALGAVSRVKQEEQKEGEEQQGLGDPAAGGNKPLSREAAAATAGPWQHFAGSGLCRNASNIGLHTSSGSSMQHSGGNLQHNGSNATSALHGLLPAAGSAAWSRQLWPHSLATMPGQPAADAAAITTGLQSQLEAAAAAAADAAPHSQQRGGGRRSRFKGLTWDRKDRRWRARIHFQGKQHHLGRFIDDHQAAKAFDRAAFFLWGRHAVTNFGIAAAAADPEPIAPDIRQLRPAADHLAANTAVAAADDGSCIGVAAGVAGPVRRERSNERLPYQPRQPRLPLEPGYSRGCSPDQQQPAPLQRAPFLEWDSLQQQQQQQQQDEQQEQQEADQMAGVGGAGAAAAPGAADQGQQNAMMDALKAIADGPGTSNGVKTVAGILQAAVSSPSTAAPAGSGPGRTEQQQQLQQQQAQTHRALMQALQLAQQATGNDAAAGAACSTHTAAHRPGAQLGAHPSAPSRAQDADDTKASNALQTEESLLHELALQHKQQVLAQQVRDARRAWQARRQKLRLLQQLQKHTEASLQEEQQLLLGADDSTAAAGALAAAGTGQATGPGQLRLAGQKRASPEAAAAAPAAARTSSLGSASLSPSLPQLLTALLKDAAPAQEAAPMSQQASEVPMRSFQLLRHHHQQQQQGQAGTSSCSPWQPAASTGDMTQAALQQQRPQHATDSLPPTVADRRATATAAAAAVAAANAAVVDNGSCTGAMTAADDQQQQQPTAADPAASAKAASMLPSLAALLARLTAESAGAASGTITRPAQQQASVHPGPSLAAAAADMARARVAGVASETTQDLGALDMLHSMLRVAAAVLSRQQSKAAAPEE